MTDRGLPLADGAPACPFVAFEDDRDERSSVPDHRHRCYADARPAPRALAHQEAYCLSSAFPVCPTFQDWARREAARSRGGASAGAAGTSAPSASAAMHRAASEQALETAAAEAAIVAGSGLGVPDDRDDGDEDQVDDAAALGTGGALAAPLGAGRDVAADPADDHDDAGDPGSDDLVRRNPPRDWAAPPPWLASAEGRRTEDPAEPPAFLGHRTTQPGQGLAGSPADRMAGGAPPPRRDDDEEAVWSRDSRSAAAVGAGLAAGDHESDEDDLQGVPRGEPGRAARRPRAYAQHLGGPDGPDWERPRRQEVYPTIQSRVAVPQVPRVAVMAGAVVILALALFFIVPTLLNVGGPTTPAAHPSASTAAAGASQSAAPTASAEPTAAVYTIKKNDTLLKVAKAHGITLEELLAANPAIKNPNKISEGQQITIPTPSDEPPDVVGESAAP